MRTRLTGYRARRRRRLRLAVAAAALACAAALGVAALVTSSTSGKVAIQGSSSNTSPGPGLTARPGGPRPRLGATARARDREGIAISSVLRYTPFIAAGSRRKRMIALTFDDGPGPYTATIVRILARMHVPATFFIVGQQLNDFAPGVRAELGDGFDVGDHTENHVWLSRLKAAGQYGQIHDAAVRMQRLGAPFPRLFRPPYGGYDRRTIQTLRRLNMLMVLWSIDPGDWRRPGVRPIVANVLSASKPGAIVILHDGGGDRSQTVAALPAIINGLRRRRYQLVTVPQLIASDPPPRHQRLPHLSGV